MSEHLPHPRHPESSKPIERGPEEKFRVAVEHDRSAVRHEKSQPLEMLQKNVEAQARSSAEMSQPNVEKNAEPTSTYINRELKDLAYRRTMSRVRSRLSQTEKIFSRVVHAPVIDEVSELASNTIARPSGILGGSIAALIGSTFVLYLAKHYGFAYNFLLFGLLFSGGFVFGILVEIGFNAIRKLRN
jgi:hypothetical protein